MKNNYLRGIICTLLGAIAWGFSGACGQMLTQTLSIDATHITFIKTMMAGLILLFISVLKERKQAFAIFKNKKSVLRLVAFSALGLLMSQLSYLKTISYSNAATATVLQYLGPVFIMIYVCLKKMQLPKKNEALALFCAFFGVFVLATRLDFSSLALSKECLLWGLIAAFALVFYTLLPAKLFESYSTISVTGFGMLIGGIFVAFIDNPWAQPAVSFTAVPYILGMVLIGTVFAYTFYLQGVADIGASRASMIACVEPVSAALFSFVWLKTPFVPIDIVGFILVLSAVFLLKEKDNN